MVAVHRHVEELRRSTGTMLWWSELWSGQCAVKRNRNRSASTLVFGESRTSIHMKLWRPWAERFAWHDADQKFIDKVSDQFAGKKNSDKKLGAVTHNWSSSFIHVSLALSSFILLKHSSWTWDLFNCSNIPIIVSMPRSNWCWCWWYSVSSPKLYLVGLIVCISAWSGGSSRDMSAESLIRFRTICTFCIDAVIGHAIPEASSINRGAWAIEKDTTGAIRWKLDMSDCIPSDMTIRILPKPFSARHSLCVAVSVCGWNVGNSRRWSVENNGPPWVSVHVRYRSSMIHCHTNHNGKAWVSSH